jgi:SAM-dependent methyltransferase
MSGDPFTGEFLVETDPRFAADIAQHLVPYLYCAPRVAGARVAEIGCGSGYGAPRLAASARQVDAFDQNPRAIEWARAHYNAANLRYLHEGSDPAPSPGEYDAVVCFQVLEHLERPEPFLGRLRELLRPGGALYLTTPNRITSAGENIYHVHEYEPDELAALLRARFETVSLLGITGGEGFRAYQTARRAAMQRFLRWDPLGARRLVPRRWLEALYPRLARAVRERSRPQAVVTPVVRPEEFRIAAESLEAADDLFALCLR